MAGREGKGREGKGREGKGREGKGREGRMAYLEYGLYVSLDGAFLRLDVLAHHDGKGREDGIP